MKKTRRLEGEVVELKKTICQKHNELEEVTEWAIEGLAQAK